MALVVTLVAVAMVVSSTMGNDDDGGGDGATRTAEPRTPRDDGQQQQQPRQRTFYRVKLNDTLGLIAEETGVTVEQIETLNPDLDAQNLIVGQRIRLRE